MAHDGSLASLTEAWIAAQVETALTAYDNRKVEVFPGSLAPSGAQLVAEFLANRALYVCVLFEEDAPVALEEGAQGYDPTYAIYIAVQNARRGSARTGDDTMPGTNVMRDLLKNALHDKYPNLGANGQHTDHTTWRGVRLVFQRSDAFIMRASVVVRESPTSA
jgi:hypothetical protein